MNATKSKRIIAQLAAIVLSVGLSLAVSASSTTEPPLLGGNLIWNIESIYYYVDSSANSFVTPIANAAYNWVYTGYGWNNLYPNSRTYNITYSAIDIYGYSSADEIMATQHFGQEQMVPLETHIQLIQILKTGYLTKLN